MSSSPAQPPLVPLGSEDEVVEAIAQMIAREAVRRLNDNKIAAAGPSKPAAAIETTTPELYQRDDNARSDNN